MASVKNKLRHRNSSRPFLLKVTMPVVCILLIFPVVCNAYKKFPKTYAELACKEKSLPKVRASHPRLLLRTKPWAHGPDLETLKGWSASGSIKSFLKRKPWNPKPGMEWAFRYLLTGDESLVEPIIQRMKKDEKYWPGRLYNLCILYDWVFNSPKFSEQDKRYVTKKILKWAKQAVVYGEEYQDMWSHFSYRPVLDIAAAGVVLGDRNKEGKKYMAMARGYMEKVFFPGWNVTGGAWQGGWNYYSQGPANLFKLIAIWSSATEEDLFEKAEQQKDNWIRGHMEYLMYTMYPDHTPMESAGFGYTPDQKGGTQTLLLLARAYQDKIAAAHLRWRNKWGWRMGISQYLYYFPALKKHTSEKKSLPETRLWGRQGVGYLQMRDGWGDDNCVIDFKCGDYFWSHNFHNQNGFTIYRKGRLAIQSGIFSDGYWGDHLLYYYRPTLSANSMLVIQPDETTWVPSGRATKEGAANKKGRIKELGGQRSCYIHPQLGSGETCFTWDRYQYWKDHDRFFETGDIKAYEKNDRYTYIMGDATMAYNNAAVSYPGNSPKMDLFTRQMVYLDKKYLIIFDRVRSVKASYEKRWLLHSVGEPTFVNSSPIRKEVPFHIETYPAGTCMIENKEGRLFCKTLFSEAFITRKVGGGARISEIKPGPGNVGNAGLNGQTSGIYQKVSPGIATELAIPEAWKITFINDTEFRVKGSVTGDDGKGSIKKKSSFISKSGRLFIPKKLWQGKPAKGDTFSFSVISPSYRFWADGKNHPPPSTKGFLKKYMEGTRLDPGSWRIEVIPKNDRKDDFFLHFLYPCDRNASGVMPEVSEVETANSRLKGLETDGWSILFWNHTSLKKEAKLTLSKSEKKQVLFLGLLPGKSYELSIHPDNGKSRKEKLAASENGALSFALQDSARLGIKEMN